MQKKRFSEAKIVAILKEGEAGVPLPELARKYAIAHSTYYAWKSKYGRMSTSELQRLKQLEEENRRLKHLYAELSLDHSLIKEVLEKKFNAPVNDDS